jgi:hypothetical protein
VLPEVTICEFPAFSPGISSPRFDRASSIAFGWAPRYLSTWAPAMHARADGVRGEGIGCAGACDLSAPYGTACEFRRWWDEGAGTVKSLTV